MRKAKEENPLFFTEGPTLTKQAFKDECDINVIMARYEKTGILPNMNPREPRFGDFTSVSDYHNACNRVIAAQQAFDDLPAEVRARFENDPGQLLAALQDPSRKEELTQLGLFAPEVSEHGAAVSGDGDNLERGTAGGVRRSGDADGPEAQPGPGGAPAGGSPRL